MRGTLRWTPARGAVGVLVCVLSSASCGSSTEPSDAGLFFRFTGNGSLVEYTEPTTLFATFSTTSGQSNLVITGYDATSGANLQIYDDGQVGTGTYSGYDVMGGVLVGTLMGYETSGGIDYATDPSTSAGVTITVSEITDTRVRGTFNGRLTADGQPDLVVTAGSFVVQRIN